MSLKLDQHYQVEFIGLPGAGKSSLANDTIKHITARGIDCYDYNSVFKKSGIANKWLIAFFYYIKNFNFFFLLLRYTLRSSPAKVNILRYNFGRLTELLKHIVVLEAYKKRLESPVLFIFDQGIIQCLWSITSMGGTVNQGLLKRALTAKKNILPDLIFYVDIDPLIASNRISGRDSKCIFDYLDPTESRELFSKQKDNYQLILNVINHVKNIVVITIYGDAEIDNNLQTCSEYLYKKIMKDE